MQEAVLLRNLRESFTLWRYDGQTDRIGRKVYAAPVAIRGRWEDREERYLDERGEEKVSRSTVFVDRDAPPGSRLLRGSSVELDPEPIDGTFVVKAFPSTPTLYRPELRERRALL